MSYCNRQIRRATAAVIAAMLSSFIVAASAASADPAPNPNQQLATIVGSHVGPNRLSLAEAKAAAPTADSAESLNRVSAAATTCWYYDDYRSGKNIFGATLWTLHTRTNWCGDGSWIRSHAYTTTSASSFIGWKYYGLINNQDNYGVNWNQFESIRQGQFCLLNCLAQNFKPNIDVRVGPSGQIYHS